MSNAIDLLVVDGTLAGTKWCCERAPSPIVLLYDSIGNVFTYYTVAYQDRYWVAVLDVENLAAVPAAIAAAGWQQSWDLLRALGEHP